MADVETVTITIEADGDTEELTVPARIVDMVRDADETDAEVVGDVTMLTLANNAHHMIHHHDGEVPQDIADAEELIMDQFEERFGQTFGEATGHQH